MKITAYPLAWPAGWKRIDRAARSFGHFGTRRANEPGGYAALKDITIAEAVNRVMGEMKRMRVSPDDTVISTNLVLRLDGLPKSDQRAPDDPGAAVYWVDGKNSRCIAIDQYTKVEDNLAAIAATLEAMRAIERHGGAAILDRAFIGFAALPAPAAARPWREVLGIEPHGTVTLEFVRERYRSRASSAHPDKPGGSHAAMSEVNAAWEQAQQELAP